jgi:hypothetical protein
MKCDTCAWGQLNERLPYCESQLDPENCSKYYPYEDAKKDCDCGKKCAKMCECGVDSTGGIHSSWCPKADCNC